MENIYRGIYAFLKTYFKREGESFEKLARGQEPEALFITCVDSRIDPNLITQSKPGRLLTLRNAGNIIPSYDTQGDKNSVAGVLEFAVLSLKVKDIIVCGHSDCGAIKALFDEERLYNMPHLKEWLKIASPLRDKVAASYLRPLDENFQRIAEKENVSLQLSNIQTYPFVSQALKKGTLRLHGWYYDIGRGAIYEYNHSAGCFEKICFE